MFKKANNKQKRRDIWKFFSENKVTWFDYWGLRTSGKMYRVDVKCPLKVHVLLSVHPPSTGGSDVLWRGVIDFQVIGDCLLRSLWDPGLCRSLFSDLGHKVFYFDKHSHNFVLFFCSPKAMGPIECGAEPSDSELTQPFLLCNLIISDMFL